MHTIPSSHWIHYPEIDSTNLEAKRQLQENPNLDNLIITADSQTSGRGRRDNKWVSPPGENIMLSLISKAEISHEDISIFSLWLATSTVEVLKNLGVPIGLKWPNDLYSLGNPSKKLGGLLIEREQKHWIIGLGLNVLTTDFPTPISDTATSLKLEYPSTSVKLRHQIIEGLYLRWSTALDSPNLPSIIQSSLANFNQSHVYHEKVVTFYSDLEKPMGRIKGIDEEGALVVETFDGIQAYRNAHSIRLV